MCGASLSQVNLDGIRLPFPIRTYDHKIQRETPDDSFFRKTSANLSSFAGDECGVPRVSREYAAKVTLPGWAAEELVVAGQQFYRTQRSNTKLNTGASDVVSYDSFFNYSFSFLQFLHVANVGSSL